MTAAATQTEMDFYRGKQNYFSRQEPVGKLVYLASPYTHEAMSVRIDRFHKNVDCCGWLMSNMKDVFFYSPIAHTHPIAVRCTLPGEWSFWQHFDECILSRCSEIWILSIPGFSRSTGIKAEIEIAVRFHLPVRYVILQNDGTYIVTDTEPEDELISFHDQGNATNHRIDECGPECSPTS